MIVEREGLSARDITRVAMPSRSAAATFLALRAGAIHAAMLNGDEALLAEKEGFRSLTYDVKAPMKMAEEIPPERVLNLKLASEVKEEMEGKRSER